MAINLEDLPVEAIARILSFLDYNDLFAVSRLNDLFRDIYKSFPELQYSYALQESGMVDMDSSLDIRTKLGELERRERAWRTMDLSRKVTVKVPHRTSHIYDLSGGVYLLGDCKNSMFSRETQTLRFFDLTACRSGPEVRQEAWPEMKLETNIVDIAFGLHEFDLVAVVGTRHDREDGQGSIVLSLRELSTGAPHPLARNSDIVVDLFNGNQGKLSIMMEIVGPRLLLFLTWYRGQLRPDQQEEQDKLILYNWWEGTKIAVETAPQLTWNGFVFLSPDLVLLPHNENGLEIIRLPDVTRGYPSRGFERVLTLSLPALQPLCKLGAIQCRAEPNPVGEPHPSLRDGTQREYWTRMRTRRRRPPFAPDPEKAIVLLQIYYREFNNRPHDILNLMGQWGVLRHNVSLVVHRKFLLDLVDMFSHSSSKQPPIENGGSERESEDSDSRTEVRNIPWAQWGTEARWHADDTHVSNWITTSAGQRYAGVDEDGHIVIKDFNPHAVQRARAAQAARVATAEASPLSSSLEENGKSTARRRAWRIRAVSDDSSDSGSEGGEPEEDFDNIDIDHDFDSESGFGEVDENGDVSMSTEEATFITASQPTEASTSIDLVPRSTVEAPSTSTSTSTSTYLPDPTWKRVRLMEEYSEIEDIELHQLFNEECRSPIACVEYTSREIFNHHGRLLDEERIIGLRHDEHTGAIVQFDVFTM